MTKNWAVVIGINRYNPNNFRPLRYAQRDAHLMRDFFQQEAKFDQIYYFAAGTTPTDDSPDLHLPNGAIIPTQPTYGNLVTFLQDLADTKALTTGDNLWFFFAGHGERHQDRDYLMPMDANARGNKLTAALAISDLRDLLCRCGADNVILLLDACRSEGSRNSSGIGNEAQQGVITISACSPTQKSWEIDDLQQGAFTYALLEALRLPGERSCATVERLSAYLTHRVPALCQQHGKVPAQTPRIAADPIERRHFILMPDYAWASDIATLKADAYRLVFAGNLGWAEQLCIRANAAAAGRDPEILDILTEIRIRKRTSPPQPPQPPNPPDSRSPSPHHPTTPSPSLPTFSFEVVTVDDRGKVAQRQQREAQQFLDNLGNGITLAMVAIPGGEFLMGSKDGEGDADERPQHRVTVPDFFMGKCPVTQAQYQAIMGTNPAKFKGDNRPVETVSWNDAMKFCQRLSKKTGKDYRLPSEAEWEYACRAGTTTPFYFGATITPDLVNYDGNYPYGNAAKGKYREQTTEVGSFPPNGFGLYDLHGTVWEWCADNWHGNYSGAPTDGTVWKTKDFNNDPHVLRGGSWNDYAVYCRSADRFWFGFDGFDHYVGFRVVVSSAPRT